MISKSELINSVAEYSVSFCLQPNHQDIFLEPKKSLSKSVTKPPPSFAITYFHLTEPATALFSLSRISTAFLLLCIVRFCSISSKNWRSYNLTRGRSRMLPSLLWISTSLGQRASSGKRTLLTSSSWMAQTQTPCRLHATLACRDSLQWPGLGTFLGALGRLAALARYTMQRLLIPCKSIDSHESYLKS